MQNVRPFFFVCPIDCRDLNRNQPPRSSSSEMKVSEMIVLRWMELCGSFCTWGYFQLVQMNFSQCSQGLRKGMFSGHNNRWNPISIIQKFRSMYFRLFSHFFNFSAFLFHYIEIKTVIPETLIELPGEKRWNGDKGDKWWSPLIESTLHHPLIVSILILIFSRRSARILRIYDLRIPVKASIILMGWWTIIEPGLDVKRLRVVCRSPSQKALYLAVAVD
jgi:hypothetical protein